MVNYDCSWKFFKAQEQPLNKNLSSMWEQTKSHELFKNMEGVEEIPFGIFLFANEERRRGFGSRGICLFTDSDADTPEKVDRAVLHDLRKLSDIPVCSTRFAFEMDSPEDSFMRRLGDDDFEYEGPYLADLITCADDYRKTLKSTIDALNELKEKGSLTWNNFNSVIEEKNLDCNLWWDSKDSDTPSSFSFFSDMIAPTSLVDSYVQTDFDTWDEGIETPEKLLEILESDYKDKSPDYIIGVIGDSLNDLEESGYADGDSYRQDLRDCEIMCKKAADMAKELEHALEFDRDKAKEQNVTDPDKSIPAWTPDATKKAQTKGKSSKSKDEMER